MNFDDVLGNVMHEARDRRANWWVIAKELVKLNVVVDEETLDLLGDGDTGSVLACVKKLERFVQIICGESILDQLGMYLFNEFDKTPDQSEAEDDS
jgi:hypothetical protein